MTIMEALRSAVESIADWVETKFVTKNVAGTLDDLNTNDKTSLVAAINEVFNNNTNNDIYFDELPEAVESALEQAKASGEFDGKSAYELAVENGFNGTEEEWLASLVGKNGSDGNGIKSVVFNEDYTLTLNFDNGTSYTTPSIRGESGEHTNSVLYIEQLLTEEQKTRARNNIGINETIVDTLVALDIISTFVDDDGGDLAESDGTILVARNDDIFLPEVTDENNGDILRVVDGKWTVDTIETPGTNCHVTSVNGMTGDVVIAIPEQKEITVNGVYPDENGNIEIEIGEGGSGVVSWNDLTDKPFGEEGSGAVIEWDGNTEGMEILLPFGEGTDETVKLSGHTPTPDDLIGGNITMVMDGEATSIELTPETVEMFKEGQREAVDAFFFGDYAFIAYSDTFTSMSGKEVTVPGPGIYSSLPDMGAMGYLAHLSYGSTTIKTIDEKFIPDSIARVSDIEKIAANSAVDNPVFTSSISMGRKADSEVGYDSVAIGRECVANLDYCVAIGDTAEATNYSAIAIGTDVVAGGMYSHAGGYETDSLGYVSYTEGAHTKATGDYSHAEGCGTIANTMAQHVQGKYNLLDEDSKYLHIVGNGESDSSRSNAHTVDKEGNGWFAGTVEGEALILKSPNGTRYQITVDNNGALSVISIE